MSSLDVAEDKRLRPVAPDVVGLRHRAKPLIEVRFDRSAPPGPDRHLPNPFDDRSDEQLNGATVTTHRWINGRTAQEGIDDEDRRASEALVESATMVAESIVCAANRRAEALVAEAAAKRAEAVSLIERSTRGVEELLEVAATKAETIRQQAELARRESVRAAAARRAEADRRLADATRRATERAVVDTGHQTSESASTAVESGARVVLDLDRPAPVRVANGLQSAFERAIHETFKG